MTGKQKNIKPTLSEFLRYRKNRMTNEERNAFERELQKDPFAAEAFEGLSGLSSDNITSDISRLRSKFSSPRQRKSRFVYYRVAASAAILMAISSLFIIIERNRSKEEIAIDENKRPVIEVQEGKGLKAPNETNIDMDIAANRPGTGREDKAGEKMVLADGKQNAAPAIDQIVVIKTDTMAADKISEPEKMAAEEVLAPPKAAAAARSGKAFTPLIAGRILSSDDLRPIPGASITVKGTNISTVTDADGNFSLAAGHAADKPLVASFIGMESKEFKTKGETSVEITLNPSVSALEEVVVVGYGTQKKADAAGAQNKISLSEKYTSGEYTSPEPIAGLESFKRYIENNIVKPDIFTEGQRVVVLAVFKVKINGIPDSVKIIRSGGQPYSDEAIRLIKEGPLWKPAMENGKAVEEEVRVRIVFK